MAIESPVQVQPSFGAYNRVNMPINQSIHSLNIS